MKLDWCRRGLVTANCHYTVCSTPALFEQALRHMRIPEREWPPFINTVQSHATCWEFRTEDKMCKIVCIRGWEGRDPLEAVGLLVHEAVHIWQGFCEHIGEKAPSAEFEAYSIQTIAQELMVEFRRQVAP